MDCLDLINNRETEYRITKLEKESEELEDVVLHDEPIGEVIPIEDSEIKNLLSDLKSTMASIEDSLDSISNRVNNIEERLTTI